jgi:hypothetical protein
VPIKIKNHKTFEPNMPKVPITQLRAQWAPPTFLYPFKLPTHTIRRRANEPIENGDKINVLALKKAQVRKYKVPIAVFKQNRGDIPKKNRGPRREDHAFQSPFQEVQGENVSSAQCERLSSTQPQRTG